MNKTLKQAHWISLIALMVAVLLGGAGAARADEPAPIIITIPADGATEQAAGTPVEAPAPPAGESTNDEGDVFPPNINPNNFYVFVSAPGSGTVKGIAYADEDVLRHEPSTGNWVKIFDGTNAGLPGAADIDALTYKKLSLGYELYLSFDAPTIVPGLGTVDDSDIVKYTSILLSNPTWTLHFDGSAHGLTTDGEDIDAFAITQGNMEFSTFGGFNVAKAPSGTLKGPDEDVILYNSYYNAFQTVVDGTALGLLGTNDIRGIAFYNDSNARFRFFSMQRPFTIGTAAGYTYSGSPNDIVVQEEPMFAGPKRYGLFWDASAAGFPKVDAFDVLRK